MSQAPPAQSERRSQSLDVLRAVAVALVLWRHAPTCPAALYPNLGAALGYMARGGWVGVDLFFVLSGFLVSSLLFREQNSTGDFRIGHFYVRRGFRIYPPFYALIAFTVALNLIRNAPMTPLNVLAEIFFFQNYAEGLWGHLWSLAVEEHFYLILPMLLLTLRKFFPGPRGPFQRLPWVVAGVAVLVPMLRLLTPARNPIDLFQNYFPTHLRIDALFFGVLIAYLHNTGQRDSLLRFSERWKGVLLAAGILGLLPAFIYPLETVRWISTFGFTLFYLSAGAIVVSSLTWRPSQSKLVALVAYLGSHSYSIYLWHLVAVTWFTYEFKLRATQYMEFNWFMDTAFYFACTLAVGLGSSILLEKPVLRIRDRLFPSRSQIGDRPQDARSAPPAAEPAIASVPAD